MIFLAHYERRNGKGKKVIEKQGIITAGNPTEAITKVCKNLGWPLRCKEDNLKTLESETIYEQVDSNKDCHKICVSYLDKMMTIRTEEE